MSDIDDLLKGADEPAKAPEDEANNEEIAPESNLGLEISSLEVGGVLIEDGYIKDDRGNVWQVPGDNVRDLDDMYTGDIYKIPPEMEKNFHVQMIRQDQLKEYMLRKFVPVTQEELKIPKELIKDMGNPLDRYHCVGDSIMVKIPRVIREKLIQKRDNEVIERLQQLEPTKKMLEKAGQDGISLTVTHDRSYTPADVANRKPLISPNPNERIV